ncbi:hypothetical protein CR159_17175 [Pollutimonas subterranea]|uniref:Uncharacterized protein n=1 Tax=Pollutimonas subterranea TaxID=2045210 RepID=A0A2N4U0L8_9BURK|nr:hypothetical protein CR159_17175 [Pollutimonas subterranea]
MPSEPRNDWESAVYDLLSEQSDMTWSDAQAMIEAQELQGNDVLASAWADGLTLSQTVKLLLKMSE